MRTQEKIDNFRKSRADQSTVVNSSNEDLSTSLRTRILVLGGVSLFALGVHMIGLIDNLTEIKDTTTKTPSAQAYANLENEFDITRELAVETPLLLAAGVALAGYAYETRNKK